MNAAVTKNDQENTWAMAVHLSTLLGGLFPFSNIFVPLIIWQVKKNEMPSLEKHAKSAINFQISMLIYLIISAVLALVFIGIFGIIAIILIDIIFTIKVALAARDGKIVSYPLSINFFT